MFSLRRPSRDALDRIVRDQSARQLTYAEHGATSGSLPAGYHHDSWQADLGRFGQDRFAAAADALLRWEAQRGAGLAVFPGTKVAPGATFVILLPMPVGFVTAAGRVVYVLDEPERRGFGYGTLPRHPEQGEESFAVSREGDRLVFRVVTFSRPRHPLARLGAPVARLLQRRTNRRYLDAMRRAVP